MLKNDWERSYPIVKRKEKALQSMLKAFRPDDEIASVKPLAGGLRNTHYRVTTLNSDMTYVLRIYAAGWRALVKEAAISQLLHGKVPIPKFFSIHKADVHSVYPYAWIEYAGGELLSQSDMGAKDFNKCKSIYTHLGQLFYEINKIEFKQPGTFDESFKITPFDAEHESISNFLEKMLSNKAVLQVFDITRRDTIARLFDKFKTLLEMTKDQKQLVHGDLNADNILVIEKNGHWQVSAILDWEFAFSGTPYWDIGNLLRTEDYVPSMCKEWFVNSYQKCGGQLFDGWYELSLLLDILALLDLCVRSDGMPKRLAVIKELVQEHVSKIK